MKMTVPKALRAFSGRVVSRRIMKSALGMTAWRGFSAACKAPPKSRASILSLARLPRSLPPPSPLGLYAPGSLRRRQAAALQGASRMFMRGGEPQDHEVSARNDSLKGFFRSLFSPALPRRGEKSGPA